MTKARRFAGISRDEMAEYLGLSTQALSNYESDKRPVKLQTLRLWAIRCGVPLEWLLGEMPDRPDGGDGDGLRGRDSNPQPSVNESCRIVPLGARRPGLPGEKKSA